MDTAEFTIFIEKQGNDIYHFCRFLAMEQEKAEDLYQDTVLHAFEICEKIDPNNNPKSFFLSIAVGKWKNDQRKRGRRKCLWGELSLDEVGDVEAEGMPAPDLVVEQKEEQSIVAWSLKNMDPKFRLPMILHYQEELDIGEIAEICGIPKGTVKSRLFKGRELIRKELLRKGYVYE